MTCIIPRVPEIRLGDVNTALGVQVFDLSSSVFDPTEDCDPEPLDISGAGTLEIIFQKPDGTPVTETAVLTTDGTDGKMHYLTVADFLDTVGNWKRQGRVVEGDNDHKTSSICFKVHPNL